MHFSGRGRTVRQLTPIFRDAISRPIYLVDGFQWNLVQIFRMWVVDWLRKCNVLPNTLYRSYRGQFYGSNDRTNSVKALKEDRVLRSKLESHQVYPTSLTILQLCSVKQKHTKYKHKRIYAQWNGPSETKPNSENCKNCSSKCASDCAHIQYTIQHRTVLIISPLTSRQTS